MIRKLFVGILGVLFLISTLFSQTEQGKTLLLSQKLKTIEGKTVSLEKLMGDKGLVIIFWSNTCPWVARYEKRTIELINQFSQKGFGFILVNSNDSRSYEKESLSYMKEKALAGKYPCIYAKDEGSLLAMALGAKRTPHVFVFNNKKELLYQGAVDDNAEDPSKVKHAYLKDVLNSILQGKNVPYKKTKAIGCTIKWYKQVD